MCYDRQSVRWQFVTNTNVVTSPTPHPYTQTYEHMSARFTFFEKQCCHIAFKFWSDNNLPTKFISNKKNAQNCKWSFSLREIYSIIIYFYIFKNSSKRINVEYCNLQLSGWIFQQSQSILTGNTFTYQLSTILCNYLLYIIKPISLNQRNHR